MGLTFIAIVLLAGAWAAILLPDLRNRGGAPRRNNSNNSVKSFNQQLSGLDRTRPSGLRRPSPASRAPFARRESAMNTPRPRTGPAGRAPVAAARPGAPTPGARRRPNPPLDARSSMMPRTGAEAAKRRVLTASVLVSLAFVTLVGGLVVTRTLLFGHLVVDALLAGFVYLSWERSNRAGARRSSLVTLANERKGAVRREADGRPAPMLEDDIATVSPIARRVAGG